MNEKGLLPKKQIRDPTTDGLLFALRVRETTAFIEVGRFLVERQPN